MSLRKAAQSRGLLYQGRILRDMLQPPELTARREGAIQASIFDLFAGHEIGRELKAMSGWLDQHPALAGLVAKDLRRPAKPLLPLNPASAGSRESAGNR